MATYNGEKYLAEQIDSILAQQDVDVTLRICDDCSTDSTFEIDQEYQKRDKRVIATQNPKGLGVGLNFMQMIYEVDASKYGIFAFSDQDDVWLPDKLAVAVEVIRAVEQNPESKAIDGIGVPVLYCSDLQDVDSNLENPVCELANLKLDLSKRATLLMRNFYSGCTMVMNASMIALLQSYGCEEFPRIHDAWCAMVAYYCGNFVLDKDHAQILRRITGENTVGALTANRDLQEASFTHLKREPSFNHHKSAIKLLEGYKQYMSEADIALINSFINYRSKFTARIKWVLSSNYSWPTLEGTLLQRAKLLCGRY